MSLDAPITEYLPDFRPKLAARELPVRVRELLTHTSGLSYCHMQPDTMPYPQRHVSDGLDAPGLSMEEELRRIAAAGLLFEPGTQWGYPLGIDVLCAAIERVMDRPLPAAMAELISVVGLTNTAVEGMMGRFPGWVRDAVYAALTD